MPLVHASRKVCAYVRGHFFALRAQVLRHAQRGCTVESLGNYAAPENVKEAHCSKPQTSEFSLPTTCVVTLSQCYPLCCDPLCWALALHARVGKFPYEW